MNLISRQVSAQQERRGRIVGTQIAAHLLSVCVGITVTAEMAAGVISADVCPQHTGALSAPLVLPFRDVQFPVKRCFKGAYGHAAITVDAVWGKLRPLSTGADCYAATSADLGKSLAEGNAILFSNFPHFREIAPDLLVQVNEGNDTVLRISGKMFLPCVQKLRRASPVDNGR